MKISIHELAHSKGVPAAVTQAMLAMQERISELEAAITQPAPPAEIHLVAWRINYTINGASRSVLCGHNSVGDYRDADPKATSTPLYTKQQAPPSDHILDAGEMVLPAQHPAIPAKNQT